MTPFEIADLRISDIEIPAERARYFNEGKALMLAGSIARQGLFHPVMVRKTDARYRLISGLHRLRAHEMNQWLTIRCSLVEGISDEEAMLIEVMENLGRAELTALDRCRHIYELKQVWEKLHPETKNGGDRKSQKVKGKIRSQKMASDPIKAEDMPKVFGFAKEHADKIGLGQAAIKLCVWIWTKLAPAIRERLQGTDLADKQTELKALAGLPPAQQVQVLDVILNPAVTADNVAEALAHLAGRQALTPEVRLYMSIEKGFGKLSAELADQFVVTHSTAIMAALKRQGHI